MESKQWQKLVAVMAEAKAMTETDTFKEVAEYLKSRVRTHAKYEAIFCGVGKNWYVAEKETKTWISMGIHAQALDPVHALHGDLGMIDDQPMFFISKSGTTEELIKLARVVRYVAEQKGKRCPKMIGVFMNPHVPDDILELFDWVLKPSTPGCCAYMTNELDEMNLVPTLSICATQLILDTLGVEIFESDVNLVNGYRFNHMGGANGRALGMHKKLSSI